MPSASGASGPMMVRSDAVLPGEVDQAAEIRLLKSNVGDLATSQCRAAIARRYEHPLHLRRLSQLPGDGMLAPAAADDQNRVCSHDLSFRQRRVEE